jgi:hypothetical protein
MVPVILTEGQNGEYEVEMDTSNVLGNNKNAVEILIEDESDITSVDNTSEDNNKDNYKKDGHHYHLHNLHHLHHTIYDGWTRMSPHEISHWIDKYGITF